MDYLFPGFVYFSFKFCVFGLEMWLFSNHSVWAFEIKISLKGELPKGSRVNVSKLIIKKHFFVLKQLSCF